MHDLMIPKSRAVSGMQSVITSRNRIINKMLNRILFFIIVTLLNGIGREENTLDP